MVVRDAEGAQTGLGVPGRPGFPANAYSTVTLFARFLGVSTSHPRITATW